MVATEIVTIPVKAGADFNDPNNSVTKTWNDLLRIIGTQDGVQEIWYGPGVETPTDVQMFINWEKVEDHYKFMGSRDYAPMVERIKTIADGELNLFHVEFTAAGAQRVALGAPVTELVTIHAQSKNSELTNGAQKFAEVLNKDAQGFLGITSGWSIEDVEHEKLEGKGKILFLAIGWQSIEAHMAFRETEAFKNNIGLLREGVKASEMHHVKFISPEGAAPPRPDDDPMIGTVSGKEQP